MLYSEIISKHFEVAYTVANRRREDATEKTRLGATGGGTTRVTSATSNRWSVQRESMSSHDSKFFSGNRKGRRSNRTYKKRVLKLAAQGKSPNGGKI